MQPQDRKREPPHHFIALIAALLNTFVLVVGWQKANSLAFKVFLCLVAACLAWIVGKYALKGIRWLARKMRNRKIVAEQQVKLEEMFTRFKRFTSDNHGGSCAPARAPPAEIDENPIIDTSWRGSSRRRDGVWFFSCRQIVFV